MPKSYSSAHIIQVLIRHGFVLVNQTGSHQKFRKGEQVVIVPVPKKDMPQGTFLSIVRQAKLATQDFEC